MCLLSPGHKPAVRPSVHWARCVSHIINGSVHIETSTAISTLHSASQPVARDNTRHHRDQHWIYLFIFAFFSSSFVESTKDNPVFCYQHNDYHRRCDRKQWQTHSIFFDCCSTVCHTSAVDWAEIKQKKNIPAVPIYGYVFQYFVCHISDPTREHSARPQSIN